MYSVYSGMVDCLDMIISVGGGVGGPIERLCWWKVDWWVTSCPITSPSSLTNQLNSLGAKQGWQWCKECLCLCLSEISSASSPHCPIRPLSGLSDNNITIGHFSARLNILHTVTYNPRLQGGILHSRTSIFIFNTHLGASISCYNYKVTTQLHGALATQWFHPPYFVWNNLIIGECSLARTGTR